MSTQSTLSLTVTGISIITLDPSGKVTFTLPVCSPTWSVSTGVTTSTVLPSGKLMMLSVKSASSPL